MKLIYTFIFSLCALFFFSCESNSEEDRQKNEVSESVEIIPIETLFDEDKFPAPKHIELLKELNICDEFQKDTANYLKPACSPRFFKLFPLHEKTPIENGFLLQIKARVGGVQLRRLVVFVRERGQLVKANTFIANLIGFQKQKSGYHDLILRFNDNVDGDIIYYNTVFKWNGKKYMYDHAETIEGTDHNGPWRQRIKEEFKDSISKEILTTIEKNEMVI